MASYSGPEINESGLILAVDAANTRSYPGTGTTWTDLSGNAINGILTLGPTYTSANGGSITFDGTDDYIQFGTQTRLQFTNTQAYTISAWIYWRPTAAAITTIASYGVAGGKGYYLQADNGSIRAKSFFFDYFDGTNFIGIQGNANTLPTNQWVNIVGTNSGANTAAGLAVYINGTLASTTVRGNASPTSIDYTSCNFNIAARGNGAVFPGNIAATQVYNRALTATEILQNYNATKDRYNATQIATTGLILNLDATNTASYPGTGTTWTDLSTTANHATLTSSPTYNSSNNGSISFASNYATSPSNASYAFGTGDFTFCCWINITAYGQYTHLIALPSQSTLALKANNSDGILYLYTPTWDNYAAASTWKLSVNTWHHVVFVRQSSIGYAYLDGLLKTTKTAFTNNFTAQILNIHNGYGSEYNACKISAAQIYNRALTQAEVTQNYNTQAPTYSKPQTQPPITAGLILNLDAGNAASYPGTGTTWTDLSGNGNNGTISGTPTYTSSGTASYFTINSGATINQYIDTAVPTPTLPITINFWIYPTNVTATKLNLYDTAPNSSNVLRIYNGLIEWWNASPTISLLTQLTANNWYNLTIIYNYSTNRTITLYINGNLITTATGSTTATYAWTKFLIGNVNGNTDGVFSGRIALAQIYNRQLTATEITQNYNAYSTRYGL